MKALNYLWNNLKGSYKLVSYIIPKQNVNNSQKKNVRNVVKLALDYIQGQPNTNMFVILYFWVPSGLLNWSVERRGLIT